MTITINGQPRQTTDPLTVAALLQSEKLDRPGVAVAVNREVVRRAEWEQTQLVDGDQIEIIHAVQGG